MRNPTHRLRRAALSGALALTLAAGAVAPAVADDRTGAPADAVQAVEVAKKTGTGSSDLGSVSDNDFSSRAGADGAQKWFDGSPGWARALISFAVVAVALDVLGVLAGPVRSMLFNLLPR
ncbi:hypothetical protein [Corynebacterium pygosceleis]|uniref:Secreted protein n=1 Tax=Corynebacterium pygosceleis TaxID=2800406 RepID=A0A9Q4GKY0_9CORY|nr:hypothetical protein [Corynebacterium pygosceleis]MCK7637072.1 hypothetical protein [Corynebacterium pygosceleis]MCK7674546.1 hypothetical protein [Corynebacterium pygosceleis]MCL0120156.1 hypothetical protein [Corynebacterium pygosceleis]MCX7443700.1 hypothetical protein [Corynebacterium pygosceleis]MCX7467825.1 hypothetical protein [Corynebacterium pygosceleis]